MNSVNGFNTLSPINFNAHPTCLTNTAGLKDFFQSKLKL